MARSEIDAAKHLVYKYHISQMNTSCAHPIFTPDQAAGMKSRIASALHRLQSQLDSRDPKIRTGFSAEAFSQALRASPLTVGYQFVPPLVERDLNRVQSSYGAETAFLYHVWLLCFLIGESLDVLENHGKSSSGIGPLGFPKKVISYYYRHFAWILDNLSERQSVSGGAVAYSHDLFMKDLAVCSLRMFPAGAHVVEQLGLSRRFIVDGGWRKRWEAASFYFRKLRAHSPLYHVHLDERWLGDFSRTGWISFLRIAAEMLKADPEVKGLFGSSWFYDPCLERLSPGLLYLRKIPELGGAKLFRLGTSADDIENATRTSERRRRLYEEGKYVPASYLFIWSRIDVINWAERSLKEEQKTPRAG